MRELAEYQVDRYAAVMKWPMADALCAFESKLKQDAQRGYELDVILWAIGAQAGSKQKAPKMPAILEGV